ncbi:GNAT family N-acetyltransferase [Acinetobacter sp.]|jgi:ribosomal protein S18 acetylase RimI-like enzyme|uniref:GNAT family N-acetyltransferase n=1 Tax=Acinetobacter sp. TaxID=472 RepID=UPI00282FC003|nr:GNAT family N-acetyltransferase [Acinetobacter sp.]MDR0235743.1 GNAT family N-acetyltransferase [Acinetobacter sp.]
MNDQIRQVQLTDVERCYEIESLAYPADEAATQEKIRIRAGQYPEGFIVLEDQNQIIGFINSGSTDHVVMSDDNFKELVGHTPSGAHLVIMSVVVDPKLQGQGYAAKLMNAFIKQAKLLNKRSIYLMCKEEYIKFYEKFGFKFTQVSESSHGSEKWFEMQLILSQQ